MKNFVRDRKLLPLELKIEWEALQQMCCSDREPLFLCLYEITRSGITLYILPLQAFAKMLEV